MKLRKVLVLVLLLILTSIFVFADTIQFRNTSDNVELEEGFDDVLPILDSMHFNAFESQKISTTEGTTTAEQYLRFGDATSALVAPKAKYVKSDEGELGSFIYIESGSSETEAFFEHEIPFGSGLKSSVSSAGELEDYEDITLRIFADDYTIIDTELDQNANEIKLTLSTAAISDLIGEQETKVYTIGPNKYEVFIETISTTPKSVRLKVNGQEIKTLEEDEYYQLSDDTFLGVRKILVSSGGIQDAASIFIGAKIIELQDVYSDDSFTQGGFSLNRDKVSEGFVQIKGEVSANTCTITSIKYRAAPTTDIYIPHNGRLSEAIEDKSILMGNWDILHSGFITVLDSEISLKSSSNQEYDLVFENQEGDTYTLPFLHGTNGLGDATYSLFVKEADNSTDFVIGIGDYVVLSSGTTRNSKTYALQYNSIDTTGKTVTFNKLTSSSEQISASYSTDGMPDGTLGEGTLNLPAVTSTFYIEDATGNKLAMDFNGGGNIDGTAVDIITNGGAIINLGTTNDISFPFSFEITTEASAMEEASTDEAVSFQISGGSIVGIDVNSFSNIDLSSDADSYNGMTRYGAEYKLENTNNNDPEKLTIQYPLQQRFVDVKIELLKSTSTSTSIQEGQQSPCTNGIMDGDETGVDCGGSCSSCDEEGEETEGQDLEMGTEIEQTDLTEQSEDQCSEGCIYIDKEEKAICLSIGEFIDELYCSSPNKLLQQKRNGEECDTDYECVSNKCEEKKCGKSYSLFTMILNIALVFFLILIVIIVITLLKE